MRIFRKMSLRPPWSIFIITQKPKIIFKSNQSHWKANKIIYNFHVYTKSQFKTKKGEKREYFPDLPDKIGGRFWEIGGRFFPSQNWKINPEIGGRFWQIGGRFWASQQFKM
jgi:hypothetical protein